MAILLWLGYINLLLGAFNLIPGFPLDGGRVLRAIVWWITKDATRSTRIAVRVGQVVAVLFISYGIFEFFAGLVVSGIWLAFIGWFLLQAASATYLQIQTEGLLRNVRVRDLMSTDCHMVSPETVIQDLVHEAMFRTGARCFLVVEGGRFLGLVTPTEIRTLEPSRWPYAVVREVMRPASEVHSVEPDAPAMKAIETMVRENINQLPVHFCWNRARSGYTRPSAASAPYTGRIECGLADDETRSVSCRVLSDPALRFSSEGADDNSHSRPCGSQ